MTPNEAAGILREILDRLTTHVLVAPEIGAGEMAIMAVTEDLEEVINGLLPTQEEA